MKKQVAVTKTKQRVAVSKAQFTAVDLKNDLYQLAQDARKKNANPRLINAAVGAYRTILTTVSLELKAKTMGEII